MRDFSNEIKAYALKNAIEFGRADSGRILPKLFNHGLDKKDIKLVMPRVIEIVAEVNKKSAEERTASFGAYSSLIIENERKEGELPELENAGKKMVFRLAPYPSGDLHIGNARTYLLNALYAEKYGGKVLFMFDDTIGSEEKQADKEAYKLIKESFDWLGVKYEKPILYKSDRLEIYYKYAQELIENGAAYVCFCTQEQMKKDRDEGKECADRQMPIQEHLMRWKKMFDMKEGGAVLRLKTDMQDPNPAFRDRVLFKISDRKHPRVGNKYRIWPSLEMTWFVDDHLLGITHIIRGKDLMMETQMEKFIWDIFKWKHPTVFHNGLVRLDGVGAKISKSKAQKEVKSGEFSGWDDPRTWGMHSLRRRGIKPEAVREFVKSLGLSDRDVVVPIENLYAINRKLIDEESNRYSFVEEPFEIEIKNKPDVKEVEIPLHPSKDKKRKEKIDKIYVSYSDLQNNKGKEVRLIHLYNIKLDSKGEGKAEFSSAENKDIPKLNWVSHFVDAQIYMPDGSYTKGLADAGVEKLKKGQIVQFERFGFCRFDNKSEGIYNFWFAH